MKREPSDPIVRRFVFVALVLPAVVTTLGLVVQLAVFAHEPARIRILPGSSRALTGDAAEWLALLLTVALGFGLPAVFGLSCLPSLRRGNRSPAFRLFGAQALGLSVLLTSAVTSLMLQNAETGSSDQNRTWLGLGIGLAAGVASALAGWFLQPRTARLPPKRPVTPIDLAPSEVAAWMHMAFLPVPAVAVITAVTIFTALRAGFDWAAGDPGGIGAIFSAVTLLLIALMATTVAFRVRVDSRGLSVRSVLGIPRFRVAPDDVGSVAVVDARSLGVGGSWGIRVFPKRVTIVMRSTTGIRVTRRDGRVFFVTVEDAATGAALLDAFVAQVEDAAALH